MTNSAKQPVTMESSTSFTDQKRISLSKNLGLFLIGIFLCCIVATGILVYSFASCSCNAADEKQRFSIAVCSHKTPETTTSTSKPAVKDPQDVPTTSTDRPSTTEKAKTEVVNVRLPRHVVPHSYRLKFVPFIFEGNFTFHGEVSILVNVTKSTNVVTLHALELKIDERALSVLETTKNSSDYRKIPVLEIGKDATRQFIIIHLEEKLKPKVKYVIHMKFEGILNDMLQGFYRSSYIDSENNTRWLAATQFQATDARRAFPCFDEPAMKARFKLSIARSKNMTAVSNMPKMKTSEEVNGLTDYVWDHFEESLPMSTYLVAFVVSDFNSIKQGNFSVWARHTAISQSKYALQLGPKFLKFYEDYFGIDFPLPKIDMFAVPDFFAGAMENWGLVTYRESALLYQEGVSSRKSVQGIATVIAHELSHQWFGNLVTPSWWTDLWLNEGFASYMEYVGTNAISPEWKTLDQFVVAELQNVFSLDCMQNSHQVSIEVNNTDEINEIFDRISYSKGATIIRMMESFLSTKTFRKGLTKYLNKRAYSSASQDDLWEMLTEQAYVDGVLDKTVTIKAIMDTWTLQTGFPIVTATRLYASDSVILTQRRFMRKVFDTTTPNELWWIPVTYMGKLYDGAKSTWMKMTVKASIENLNVTANDWLLLNVMQTGYYRVNYDLQNWKLLTEQLTKLNGHLVFDPKNRAQMLDDSFSLAASGYLGYAIPFNISLYLVQEREYVPLKAGLNSLDYINDMFVRTQHFDKFKTYLVRLLQGIYNDFGFEDDPKDSALTVFTRSEILWRLCGLGMVDCLVKSVTQFENWRNSPHPDKYNPISPNLREIVYCTALKVGGQEQWDFAWERYQNANVGSEKEILMSALGCTRETWLLSRYLEWSLAEKSGIRKQDVPRIFGTVADNVVGRDLVYSFVKSNWKRLSISMSLPLNSAIVKSITRKFNTRPELDDLKAFVGSIEANVSGTRFLQQSVEQVEANVHWMEENYDKIVHWLTNFAK